MKKPTVAKRIIAGLEEFAEYLEAKAPIAWKHRKKEFQKRILGKQQTGPRKTGSGELA